MSTNSNMSILLGLSSLAFWRRYSSWPHLVWSVYWQDSGQTAGLIVLVILGVLILEPRTPLQYSART